MDVFDLQATISINIDDFVDRINRAASTAREFSQNFSQNTRGIADGEEAISDYEETLSQLRRQLSQVTQEQTETAHRADSLRQAYEESVEATGENSEESQRLAAELKTVEEQSRQLQVRSNQLSNQITETTNEMENLGDEAEDSGKNTSVLSQVFGTLKNVAGTTLTGVKSLTEHLKNGFVAAGKLALNGIKALAEHMKNGFVAASKLALTGAKNFAVGLTDSLVQATTTSLQAMGKMTSALGKFAGDSINVGKEFDSSMSQISATFGMSAEDIAQNAEVTIAGTVVKAGDTFEALRNKAKEMGAATNFSASEAADGLNILAMAGYSAADSMDMIEDVLHLAAAGGLDMATAAKDITGSMKGFNDASKDSEYYASLIAKGATLAATDVSALGEAMADGSAVAASYGQSAESMTVSLLRLAEQGETGSAASTALAAAMKNLYAPTNQAAEILNELGIKSFDETTHSARDFNDIVNELSSALSNYDDEQKTAYAQTIFGIQGFDAYNKMIVTSVDKQNEWSEALKGSKDEAKKQYDTMTNNLEGDIDIWNSALEGFQVEMSDKLMPAVRDFVKFGTDELSSLTSVMQEGGFEAVAAEIGNVLADVINKVSEYVPQIVETAGVVIKSLISGLSGRSGEIVTVAVEIVTLLIQGISESIVSIFRFGSQIIGELANGIVSAVPDILSAAGDITTAFLDSMANVIPQLINVVKLIVSNLIEGFVTEGAKIGESLSGLVDSLIKAFDSLAPYILNAALTLLDIITSPDVLSSASDMIFSIIESIANFITAAIPMISKKLPQIIKNIVQSIANFIIAAIPMITKKLPDIIENIIDFLKTSIPDFISMIMEIIDNLLPAIMEAVPDLLQAISMIISELSKALFGYLPEFIRIGVQLFTSLAGALPEIIINILDVIPELIDSIVNALMENLPMIIETGMMLFSALVEALPDIIVNIVSVLPEIISGIVDTLNENLPLLIQAGFDLFIALIDDLPEILETLSEAIPEIVGALLDAIAIALPALIDVGFDLFTALIDNLPEIILEITKAIPGIVTAIVDTIAGLIVEMVEAGANLIRGLWDGIMSVQDWFMNKVSEFCDDWIQGFKDLFGIASPSKVMRDEIGTFLAQGVGVGFSDEMDNVSKDSEKAMKSAFENLGDFDIAAPGMQAFDTSQIADTIEKISDVKLSVDTDELEKSLDNLTGIAEITPNIRDAEYGTAIASLDKNAGSVIIKNITVNMDGIKIESDYDVDKLSDRFVKELNGKFAMLEVFDKRAYGDTGW